MARSRSSSEARRYSGVAGVSAADPSHEWSIGIIRARGKGRPRVSGPQAVVIAGVLTSELSGVCSGK